MEIKKTLLVAILAALTVTGAVAKEKKVKLEEAVTVDEFFNENFTAKKAIVYKITNVNLIINPNGKLILDSSDFWDYWDSLSKILTMDEKNRIKKAAENDEYQSLKENYIVYVQTNVAKPKVKDLKVIKIENIPTEEDFAKGEEKIRFAAEQEAAQKKKIEEMKATVRKDGGYDDMPWGTPVYTILNARPDAKRIEDEGVVERYARKGSSGSEMTYKFYNGELVGGVTVYNLNGDDAETKGNDINQRMKELYGKWTDVKETSEHKNVTINFLGSTHKIAYTEKHLKTTWNKSSSFKILLDVCALSGDTKNDTYNICMYITTNLFTYTINYENPSMAKEIAEANVKLKKEQAEAKKQQEEYEKRRRMDNLDL